MSDAPRTMVFYSRDLTHHASHWTPIDDGHAVFVAWCGAARTAMAYPNATWIDAVVRVGVPTCFLCLRQYALFRDAMQVMRQAAGEGSPGYESFRRMQYGPKGVPFE